MKLLLLTFFISTIGFNSTFRPIRDKTLSAAKRRRDSVDSYIRLHPKRLLLFAKVPGKKGLVKVINNKWPDEVEYSYNILTNKSGKVIYIMQSPFSESGDWDFKSFHYFDDKGYTFAHVIKANAFVLPNDRIAYETTTDYYGSNLYLLKHEYKLVDEKGRSLDKKNYGFNAKEEGFDAKTYANVKTFMIKYQLTIK